MIRRLRFTSRSEPLTRADGYISPFIGPNFGNNSGNGPVNVDADIDLCAA